MFFAFTFPSIFPPFVPLLLSNSIHFYQFPHFTRFPYPTHNNIMSTPDQLKTIKCPYNPAHVMPYDRFLSHLEKCQFPNKKSYRSCKYNPYHVFHLDALTSHQNKCPDRKKYEQEDDDWGVVEQPKKEMKEQVSIASHSTSFSESQMVKKTSQKGKGKETGKKINNTQFIAQDLDEYNPQDD